MGSVVIGGQRPLDGFGGGPVVPDGGGHGQQPLGDAHVDAGGGAAAVAFQVELGGLQPPTPCLQNRRKLSDTVAHLGLRPPLHPMESGLVGSCCGQAWWSGLCRWFSPRSGKPMCTTLPSGWVSLTFGAHGLAILPAA